MEKFIVLPAYSEGNIIKEVIRDVQKEGFNNIELWVLEENIRAKSFYERVGFKYDNTFQEIDMGKELRYIIEE